MLKFSVIMSIYKSDVPEYVRIALDSILNQTLLPNEIVIVGDGPVPAPLEQVIRDVQSSISSSNLPVEINYLPQEKNRGLGEALRIAVENAKYDYLARMDSDDICMPDRFEKQMRCFEEDPDLSIVGGMITEFVDSPDNVVDKRVLPLDLLRSGNYRSDYRQEDYYLWARMLKAGCKFRNIPDVVVNVRSGYDQFARRSGWSYYLDHCAIFRFMYREGLISFPRLVYNYVVRGVVQFLMPNSLRTWVYQNLLRK